MYEGEARTKRKNISANRGGKGKMELGTIYSMTLEDKTGTGNTIKHPPNKFTVGFQCEESVLNQMVSDGVNMLWSGEIVEDEI